MLSELDAYIAGILVCPDLIMPSEWLPRVWGGEEEAPVFDSADDLKQTVGLIMQHYNAVSRDLQRGRYEPIYEVDPNSDEVHWEFWVGGFARAMTLRPDSWTTVIGSPDQDAVGALAGLMALVGLSQGRINPWDDGRVDGELTTELTEDAPDLIPAWIEALNARRLKRDRSRPPAARTARSAATIRARADQARSRSAAA